MLESFVGVVGKKNDYMVLVSGWCYGVVCVSRGESDLALLRRIDVGDIFPCMFARWTSLWCAPSCGDTLGICFVQRILWPKGITDPAVLDAWFVLSVRMVVFV